VFAFSFQLDLNVDCPAILGTWEKSATWQNTENTEKNKLLTVTCSQVSDFFTFDEM
jgi:hypothetical protein